MSDETRTYRKRRRAELEEQTRLRITESAVALHGSVGPAKTSISALAELAGVRRSTVYRHFPDETALFDACSGHWRAANPPPDPAGWGKLDVPDARLRQALAELYPYYRRVEPMLANLLHDAKTMPVVRERLATGYLAYIVACRELLMKGRGLRGGSRRRVAAAIGHALAFATWRSLARDQGLDDAEAAELMCRAVEAAQAPVSARA